MLWPPAGHPQKKPIREDLRLFTSPRPLKPTRTDIGNLNWFDRIDASTPIVSFLRRSKLDIS